MTNPTLERAARALADHFGCEWETMRDADRETIRGYCRAVLMAVRDEMVDVAAIKPTVDFARTNRETELVLDYAQQGFTSTINKILVREDS